MVQKHHVGVGIVATWMVAALYRVTCKNKNKYVKNDVCTCTVHGMWVPMYVNKLEAIFLYFCTH
jgi:hypothetical protein